MALRKPHYKIGARFWTGIAQATLNSLSPQGMGALFIPEGAAADIRDPG